MTPDEKIQSISEGGIGSSNEIIVPYHTHDGINSPKLVFACVPIFAGTLTGTSITGNMVYDTVNNKLYIYNDGWFSVQFS